MNQIGQSHFISSAYLPFGENVSCSFSPLACRLLLVEFDRIFSFDLDGKGLMLVFSASEVSTEMLVSELSRRIGGSEFVRNFTLFSLMTVPILRSRMVEEPLLNELLYLAFRRAADLVLVLKHFKAVVVFGPDEVVVVGTST